MSHVSLTPPNIWRYMEKGLILFPPCNQGTPGKENKYGLLSRKANVPLSVVQRLCNDTNYIPSVLTLIKVARYLKVPLEDLFIYEEDGE